MRHAYCIIAHNEPEVFKVLISLLDDERNDIFIHVDKRSDITLFNSIRTEYSRIYFLPKRIKTYWGGFSLTKVYLRILQYAFEKGEYKYYHILSGVDLPIKSQDYIHHLFDVKYPGKEFVGIAGKEQDSWIRARAGFYYPFDKRHNFQRQGSPWGRLMYRIQYKLVAIQKRMRIIRSTDHFAMGPGWFSLTEPCVKYLLSHKKCILNRFKYTTIADEMAFQTIIINSPFRSKIFDINDQYHSCLRKIDWERGNHKGSPYTWQEEDFEELINNDEYCFARKFSQSNIEIAKKIEHHLSHYK